MKKGTSPRDAAISATRAAESMIVHLLDARSVAAASLDPPPACTRRNALVQRNRV